MITFSWFEQAEPIRGKLVYTKDECSFGFEPDVVSAYAFLKRAGFGSAPLVIDHYLQLEVSVQTSMLLYVTGLHNYQRWTHAKKLIAAAEVSHPPLPVVPPDTGVERPSRDERHKLRKHHLPVVHDEPLLPPGKGSNVGPD